MAASAVTIAELGAWRTCNADDQCIIIEGTCDKTSVNKRFKRSAEMYYAEMRPKADCVDRFWVPKDVIAQCKPLAASKATKDAEPVANSECAAVAKPRNSE